LGLARTGPQRERHGGDRGSHLQLHRRCMPPPAGKACPSSMSPTASEARRSPPAPEDSHRPGLDRRSRSWRLSTFSTSAALDAYPPIACTTSDHLRRLAVCERQPAGVVGRDEHPSMARLARRPMTSIIVRPVANLPSATTRGPPPPEQTIRGFCWDVSQVRARSDACQPSLEGERLPAAVDFRTFPEAPFPRTRYARVRHRDGRPGGSERSRRPEPGPALLGCRFGVICWLSGAGASRHAGRTTSKSRQGRSPPADRALGPTGRTANGPELGRRQALH